jgi:hypothetical protein
MNEAIKLAKENGYSELNAVHYHHDQSICICQAMVPQDPLFWQSLGKAFRWEEDIEVCGGCGAKLEKQEITPYGKHKGNCDSDVDWNLTWKFWAHEYFDLVLTGGDTEKFWKELTENKSKPLEH